MKTMMKGSSPTQYIGGIMDDQSSRMLGLLTLLSDSYNLLLQTQKLEDVETAWSIGDPSSTKFV